MSLNVKTSKDIQYLYFQAGKASIYIGPEGEPGKAKAKNIARALEYARGREEHYAGSIDALLKLLPREERGRHLDREAARLEGRASRYKRMAGKPQK